MRVKLKLRKKNRRFSLLKMHTSVNCRTTSTFATGWYIVIQMPIDVPTQHAFPPLTATAIVPPP